MKGSTKFLKTFVTTAISLMLIPANGCWNPPPPDPETSPSPDVTTNDRQSPLPTESSSSAPALPLTTDKDQEFEEKIIGTWETKLFLEDGTVFIGRESFYPSNEYSGSATLTFDKKNSVFLKYSGTWRIEDGYLYYKITSSNYPEVMPVGDISANQIVNITERDYVYIDSDGNQQIDRKVDHN
jgi:hypothetical protein